MATRFLDKITTADTNKLRNLPDAAGIAIDTVDSLVKYNKNGTVTSLAAAPAPIIELVPTAVTVAATDSGQVYIQTLASGTQTYTLPLASTAPGCKVTFICQHAGSEILVNPNAADQISIKGLVDHSTSVKPAAGTGVKNTASGNVIGDHLTLICDGVNTWYEIAGAGIWASQ